MNEFIKTLKDAKNIKKKDNSSHSIIQSYLSYILLDNKFSPIVHAPAQKDHHSVSKMSCEDL